MEGDGDVYRKKGADPKGVITRLVAGSEKNVIADIRQSVATCPDPKQIEKMLTANANRHLPPYKEDKPGI